MCCFHCFCLVRLKSWVNDGPPECLKGSSNKYLTCHAFKIISSVFMTVLKRITSMPFITSNKRNAHK